MPVFFSRPQDLTLLQEIKPAFTAWLQALGVNATDADTIHARLKARFVLSLHQQWSEKSGDYAAIKQAIDTPFTKATQLQQSWRQYHAWLQEQLNERMFDEVFGLKQVYVPLRGCYYEQTESEEQTETLSPERNRGQEAKVIDLTRHLTEWVQTFNKDDDIRVISGGPGSGKSSFSKLFAAHIAETTAVPVLLIPLHHFKPSLDLIDAVNQFVAADRYLSGTPLHAKDGEPRLLIIFDGLDELSMQGKAASEVAMYFVDEVISHLNHFKFQGLERQVLFTGRDLAVQNARPRFRKAKQILHILPYWVTEQERTGYLDPEKLLTADQRDDWWRQYAQASGRTYPSMPEELQLESLEPITKEPLLNYLVALSYQRQQLDFTQQTTLNEIYSDLLQAVYKRQWADGRKHAALGELNEDQFLRILEEIALAVWHGDGRTATVATIHRRCEKNNLTRYLDSFQGSAEQGVTRLLTAFYFRQSDKWQDGDKAFEFTHKSFGEYLTACRIVRLVEKIQLMFERHDANPDDGWDEQQALLAWAELCGATAIDDYLFKFLGDEIARRDIATLEIWQRNFSCLISSAVKHAMPMEKVEAVNSFQQMLRHSRNAEEALLVIHCACAVQTKTVIAMDWGTRVAAGEWLKRLQGQREGHENKQVKSMAYLDLSGCALFMFDFYDANLRGANLKGSYLRGANIEEANLVGANLEAAGFLKADLEEANLVGAYLDRAYLQGANFEEANLEGAHLGGTTGANLKNIRGTPRIQPDKNR